MEKQIDASENLVIKTSHPSPLGYTKSGKDFIAFKESGQFNTCNTYLKANKQVQISWEFVEFRIFAYVKMQP